MNLSSKSVERSSRYTRMAILAITFLLTLIGFIFIYSSSSVYALEQHGSALFFVKRQLVGFAISLFILIATVSINPRALKKLSPFLFIGAFCLTALTLIPALRISVHGSNRWIHIFSIVFQPSELLKPAAILLCAYFLSTRHHAIKSFFASYLPVLLCTGLVACMLLLQPDFGQTITLTATILCMLFIAQTPSSYLAYTALLFAPIGAILIILKPYRLQRILTFLNPWQDPQGKGFQIIQSLIAIGSGGVSGVGIAHSRQKFFYLPMQHTDFIFSIIAEETGFIGCAIILFLFFAFFVCGVRLATKSNDMFSRFAIFGATFMLVLQAFVNISVTTALLPTKGLSLPFISYGNSALISSFWLVGIILCCSRRQDL